MPSWSEYVQRLAGGLTSKEIAARVGVDSSQVSRWKSGQVPTAENALRFAEEFQGDPFEALVAAGHGRYVPDGYQLPINSERAPKHGVETLEDTWADRDHRISPSKLQQLQAETVAFIGTRAEVADQLIVIAGNLADSLGHLERGNTGTAWVVLMNSSERLVRLAAALTAQAYMADPYGDTNEGPTLSEFRKKLDDVTALLRRLEELAVTRSRATGAASEDHTKEDGNAVETPPQSDASGETGEAEEGNVTRFPHWGRADPPPDPGIDEHAAASEREKDSPRTTLE